MTNQLSQSDFDRAIDLLRQKVASVIAIPDTQEFTMERVFFEHYAVCDAIRIKEAEPGEFYDESLNSKFPCCGIDIVLENTATEDVTQLRLVYYFESHAQNPKHSCLYVTDDENNLLFWYSQDHDLKQNQWYINSFAQDLEDENGNYVFDGEPIQI